MQQRSESMEGGFENPVFDSQKTFDIIINAMARPGKISALPSLAHAPAPLTSTSATVIQALCDNDTAVWLDKTIAREKTIKDWLAFHTGAAVTDNREAAQFSLIADLENLPDLATFSQGSQQYPDRSTTLLIQVDVLRNGPELTLTGPGIDQQTEILIEPISPLFLDQWQANNQLFPRGVDVIFTTETSIMCLPRTTKISSKISGRTA